MKNLTSIRTELTKTENISSTSVSSPIIVYASPRLMCSSFLINLQLTVIADLENYNEQRCCYSGYSKHVQHGDLNLIGSYMQVSEQNKINMLHVNFILHMLVNELM